MVTNVLTSKRHYCIRLSETTMRYSLWLAAHFEIHIHNSAIKPTMFERVCQPIGERPFWGSGHRGPCSPYNYTACMDYMDLDVCCPKKAVKLNHSLTHPAGSPVIGGGHLLIVRMIYCFLHFSFPSWSSKNVCDPFLFIFSDPVLKVPIDIDRG